MNSCLNNVENLHVNLQILCECEKSSIKLSLKFNVTDPETFLTQMTQKDDYRSCHIASISSLLLYPWTAQMLMDFVF